MRCFITGITGSLGTALTILHHLRGDQVWGCARSESKAVEWLRSHGRKATLFLDDAIHFKDVDSDISRLLPSMDRVYHCAAMKHVDICEKHPVESLINNVALTDIVAYRCKDNGVPCVVISSDKACLPQSVYGASKLMAERVALRHGASVVRLGNLIGSSGSVFHYWRKCIEEGKPVTLTDPEMTRFFIPIEQAVSFIADHSLSGVVSIPHMLSVRMGDVANVLCQSRTSITRTAPRPGETQHQWLLAPGDHWYSTERGYVLDRDNPSARLHMEGLNSNDAARWNVHELIRIIMDK